MRILALDTTGDCGSFAIWDAGRVLEEVAVKSPEGFGHVLFDEIARLLARHDLALKGIDGYAAAAGPGSFTGVRVGLTAAKGLAEANGKQVVAVSNLQAIASFGSRPLRAAVLDARRGEIYGAVYDASLNLVQDEVVTPVEAWLKALPQGDLEIVTCGFELPPQELPVIPAPQSLAGAIAVIAAHRFEQGLAQDPAVIDANYVRRSDAELLWRDPLAQASTRK